MIARSTTVVTGLLSVTAIVLGCATGAPEPEHEAQETTTAAVETCAAGSGGKLLGDKCRRDHDCCSGRCQRIPFNDNYCVRPVGQCRPRGEICDPYGANECCSGACDRDTIKCQAGGSGGSVLGDTCRRDSDCESGRCQRIPFHDSYCVRPAGQCRPRGEICDPYGASECCSGVCDRDTIKCKAGGSGGATLGDTCQRDRDCESGRCQRIPFNGSYCVRPAGQCRPRGEICDPYGANECCSGACDRDTINCQ
jgi:hypothetical protein